MARLSGHALGLHMRLFWTGVAAHLWRPKSLQWISKRPSPARSSRPASPSAAMIFRCFSRRQRPRRSMGRLLLHRPQNFGSLAPVWTRHGLRGVCKDAEEGAMPAPYFVVRCYEQAAPDSSPPFQESRGQRGPPFRQMGTPAGKDSQRCHAGRSCYPTRLSLLTRADQVIE